MYNMYNIYMSRRRRSATPRRNANDSELDGYNTEDEFPLNRSNIDIHGKWLQKERDENDRPLIRDTKSMWEIVPADLKPALLYYLTEEDGKSLGAEEQKNLIHDVVRSYHKGRNGKNNKYGHAILDEHRPCCTECVKSCVGKLCGGKTHCKECKRTLLDGAFYFEENKNNNEKMRCKPAGENEGGYKRTRRRRKKNRKKRTKKKARRKRRRKSSNRRRRRKR